jgi:outer membrane protein assembly factor BamB
MKNKRTQTILCATMILIMAFSALMATTPLTQAAPPHETFCYIAATPNPIGVNQQVNLQFFMPNVPPAQYPLVAPRYGYWYNFTIRVTKPDGTPQLLTNIDSGEAGAGYIQYTVTQTGIYQFQVSFPGQTIETGAAKGTYYKPSSSPVVSLTVQQQPIETTPEYPLPTNYWTTPIEGQNRAWSQISGNWLAGESMMPSGNGYNPYTTAPNSGHIVWTRQQTFGGLVGGDSESAIYNQGRWPAGTGGYFGPPIIISGILYINEPRAYDTINEGFKAIDLFTGETIWTNPTNDALTMAQIYRFSSRMTSIIGTYLWSMSGTTWKVYDPLTGEQILNATGVVSGGRVTAGPDGELLIYNIGGRNNWLSMWNSTLFFYSTMMTNTYSPIYAPDNTWAVKPGTYNWTAGLQWNVTTPNLGSQAFTNGVIPNDVIIAQTTFAATDAQPQVMMQQVAYSIKTDTYKGNGSGQQAQVLWGPVNRTAFIDGGSYERIEAIGEGIYVIYHREELKVYGYDAHTGTQLWVTEPYSSVFAMFTGEVQNFVIVNGKVYSGGYDGSIYAHDAKTGKLLWKFYAGSSGFETPYESWPIEGSYVTFRVADGKIFAVAMEHSPSFNTWRFGKVWCINETNGELVWSVLGSKLEVCPSAVAYGMFIYMNQYDGKIYCFGKGPSATTVSAPQSAAVKGHAITITGTVADQSVGAKGTPAIADESMSAWMEYTYMQKPKPTNATGVQVKLTAVDPNGNTQNIGTTTSDANGNYGLMWTPPVEGLYKITATFTGSESYYPSDATTYLGVETAPSAAPTENPTPISTPTPIPPTIAPTATPSPSPVPNTGTGIGTEVYIAIAAAVIIAAVAATAIVLRKRK